MGRQAKLGRKTSRRRAVSKDTVHLRRLPGFEEFWKEIRSLVEEVSRQVETSSGPEGEKARRRLRRWLHCLTRLERGEEVSCDLEHAAFLCGTSSIVSDAPTERENGLVRMSSGFRVRCADPQTWTKLEQETQKEIVRLLSLASARHGNDLLRAPKEPQEL
jgi:hypothetical protein